LVPRARSERLPLGLSRSLQPVLDLRELFQARLNLQEQRALLRGFRLLRPTAGVIGLFSQFVSAKHCNCFLYQQMKACT
jgi:hypothetical protein